ncbi:MAG: protein phosphatase 2C domain-containing protein, partial [Clostridiales bacterium]|nr:protein phosphatase 2C domain-containing protein [Clostridiales bacterium]
MVFKSFARTCLGQSHIDEQKVCQDNSGFIEDRDGDVPFCVAIVADGHGGKDYFRSDKGSHAAVSRAEKGLRNFVSSLSKEELDLNTLSERERDRVFRNLFGNIISNWHASIAKKVKSEPFQEEQMKGVSEQAKRRYLRGVRTEEAYGTTLLAVCVTNNYW